MPYFYISIHTTTKQVKVYNFLKNISKFSNNPTQSNNFTFILMLKEKLIKGISPTIVLKIILL